MTPPESAVVDLNWMLHLEKNDEGKLKKNLSNLMMCMRHMPGLSGTFRYNELTGTVEWNGKIIQDHDYVDIRLIIESRNIPYDKNDIPIAVTRTSRDSSYHPIRDYLESLQWDGTDRIYRWLNAALGVEQDLYSQTVGTKFMIGAVARVYSPGCKMDNMLVLEGPQDLGKSTALRTLFGSEYFVEATADMRDHPRFVAQMKGKWILEFAELAAIRRSEVEMVKAIITTQIDRVRLPYRRDAEEHPRRCVLAATVNPQEEAGYLTDPTGNRRFWPVLCSRIAIDKLAIHRDQLWAEATHRYKAGEHWWLENGEREHAKQEQGKRVSIDPWQDHLRLLIDKTKLYSSVELLAMLEVKKDRQTQSDKIRVAKAMTALGWEQKRQGERYWRFVVPAEPKL